MDVYEKWISEYKGEIVLKCAEVTLEMNKVFPELRRVRGYVDILCDSRRPHWWLVDPNGVVVDPTSAQWATPIVWYEEVADEDIPNGKCMECGEYCYGDHYNFCSKSCEYCYVWNVELSLTNNNNNIN